MFDSFRELYDILDLLKCGYDKINEANTSYTDMEEYYSDVDLKMCIIVQHKATQKKAEFFVKPFVKL